MDGVAIDPGSGMIVVTDGYLDLVHVFGAGGRHVGQFGDAGADAGADAGGRFVLPDGVAFLPDGSAAVADSGSGRVLTLEIGADDGRVLSAGGFESQLPPAAPTRSYTTQQLAAGPGGSLYAADYGRPSVWTYLPGPGGMPSSAARIDDPSLRGLGGIAIDPGGLVYVSEPAGGRVRVYDPGSPGFAAATSASSASESRLGGVPLDVRTVRQGAEAFVDEFGSRGRYSWQLASPHGVALGPPDPGTGDVRVYVADRNAVKVYEKDREPPSATAVWSHTPDGTVAAGGTAEIAVNFSERVTVVGSPSLALALAAAPGQAAPGPSAAYVSGSGSRTLTFNYTVPATAGGGGGGGPGFLDHAGADSLVLAAGDSIADGGGNMANLTLPARGSAASLAANAALWIDPGGQRPEPSVRVDRVPTIAAIEGRAVLLALNATVGDAGAGIGGNASAGAAANMSYSWAGLPAGAAAGADGSLSWTPAEDQGGMHALTAAAALGGSGQPHIRAVRILVAEDNEPPAIGDISDVQGAELAEIRFDVDASDADVPAQRLRYGLVRDGAPFGAAGASERHVRVDAVRVRRRHPQVQRERLGRVRVRRRARRRPGGHVVCRVSTRR